jgi:hypothetical protein
MLIQGGAHAADSVDARLFEVPALDRKSPSTKFRVRGRQLSVDLLTPMPSRPSSAPILLRSLKAYAEPVRFLEYLIEDAQPAILVAKAGILVNVPTPARFVFHKLVISNRRAAAFQAKARKDIDQADQLLLVLLRHRPGDLRQAWGAAVALPDKFMAQLRLGIEKLSHSTRTDLETLTGNV